VAPRLVQALISAIKELDLGLGFVLERLGLAVDKPPVGSELKSIRPRGDAMHILVADDHDIVRRGLKQLLNSRPGWEVCAEASTGREAVTLAEQLKPKVVVMDISMPELNGLEAARKILKILPKTEIVILTLHFSDQLVREILASGARGYIMKSDADRDLVAAVEASPIIGRISRLEPPTWF